MQISDDLGKLADEPVSLPTLDVAADKISFHHNDPAYHSINVPNFSLKVSLVRRVLKLIVVVAPSILRALFGGEEGVIRSGYQFHQSR